MHLIRPSKKRSLEENKSLATFLLKDILNLLGDRRLISIQPLVNSFSNRLRRTSLPQVNELIGPELYRWYFDALDLLDSGKTKEYISHCTRLPNFLFLRYLVSHRGPGRFPAPLSLDSHSELFLPQLSKKLKLRNFQTNKVQVNQKNGDLIFQDYHQTLKVRHEQFLKEMRLSYFPETELTKETPILLKQSGYDLENTLRHLRKSLQDLYRKPISIRAIPLKRLLNGRREKKIPQMTRRALKLIRTVWPEHYEEICSTVYALCFVEGPALVGSSNIAYHGVVILNPKQDWTVLTYVDHLIHESAHQVLLTKYELEPLLKNPRKGGLPSPIRWDPRPLHGVFQATFVYYRLCLFFEKMARRFDRIAVINRFHRHLLAYFQGIDTVAEHAEFTPKGRRLFKIMIAQAEEWKRRYPNLDAGVFQKIGNDYAEG